MKLFSFFNLFILQFILQFWYEFHLFFSLMQVYIHLELFWWNYVFLVPSYIRYNLLFKNLYFVNMRLFLHPISILTFISLAISTDLLFAQAQFWHSHYNDKSCFILSNLSFSLQEFVIYQQACALNEIYLNQLLFATFDD